MSTHTYPWIAHLAMIALASPGLGPAAASAQVNLVMNPGFDVDLSAWQVIDERPASWHSEDVAGDPASGSALLAHADTSAGGNLIVLRQCVAIPSNGVYRLGAWIRNPADQPAAGNASILAIPARFPDCTGSGPLRSPTPATSAEWEYREWDFDIRDDGVEYQAMWVNLAIYKPIGTSAVHSALFDDVSLVLLEGPDLVFANGFDTP